MQCSNDDTTHQLTGSALLMAAAVIAVISGLFTYRFSLWDFDDGFIVYRVVANFLAGEGWSYNPGEIRNASTSVLNTVILILAAPLVGDIQRASHLLSAIWLSVSGVSVFLLLERSYGRAWALISGAVVVTLIAVSSTWGIETHLFLALLLLFIVLETRGINTWYLLGLLILTRPDAIVLAALKWGKDALTTRERLVKGPLQCLAILAPWIIFSVTHFQQLFPDTLSSKRWQGNSGYWGHGWVYFRALGKHLIESSIAYKLAVVASLYGTALLVQQRSALLFLVAFVAAQQSAYILLNVPGYHWYFVSLDVVVGLVALVGVGHLLVRIIGATRAKHGITFALACLAVLAIAGFRYPEYFSSQQRDPRNEAYRALTELVNAPHQPEGPVAALEVGTVGYYTPRKIIDLTGLVSTNPEYITGRNLDRFFEQPPALVILHNPPWHFERALFDDLRFKIAYGDGAMVYDPFFPMALYSLKGDRVATTRESFLNYIQENFQPFVESVNPNQRLTLEAMKEVKDSCILDSINGQLVTSPLVAFSKATLRFSGWAVDRERSDLGAVKLHLVGDNHAYTIVAKRQSRPDVAQHLGRPELSMAGFDAEGSVLNVQPGEYLIVATQEHGDRAVRCMFGTKVLLSDVK